MAKVSVIIPVYNTEQYLKKCLDSVCGQTLKDLEIICINDCSPDGSLQILKEYAANDNRIKIIDFKENKGAAAARNAGINAASGEYLGFVDSDDFIDLDFYEKLYDKAIETGAEVVKGSDLKLIHVNGQIEVEKRNQQVRQNKINFVCQYTTAIFKREFIVKNKIDFPHDLSVGEDPVFTIKAAILAKKIEVIDGAQYYYCKREGSLNSTVWKAEKVRSYAKYIRTVADFVVKSKLTEEDYKTFYRWMLYDVFAHKENKALKNAETDEIFNSLLADIYKLRPAAKRPVRILFDVFALAQAHDKNGSNGFRSGVYFVIFNVLEKFLKDKNFDITLFLPQNAGRNILSNMSFFEHCKFTNDYFRVIKDGNSHLIKNTKFDLIDYDLYFSGAGGWGLDFSNKIRQAYILHDTIPLMFDLDFYGQEASGFHNYYKNIPADSICFCVSENTKNDFKKFFPHLEKFFVAPNATAREFYFDKDKDKIKRIFAKYDIEYEADKKYLFSLCSVDVPRKQIIFQIKCFLKMIKENNINDLYFYLGGGNYGKNYETLKKELANLFDEDKIRLLGYVDDEDVNALYSNSLFFTYVSQYEGFGMPPLEAMSAGTPVVTSNTSSLPEVVGDAAITVNPDDEKAIIKAYENLYFDEALRESFIKKGIKRAKAFSWDKTYGIISKTLLTELGVSL